MSPWKLLNVGALGLLGWGVFGGGPLPEPVRGFLGVAEAEADSQEEAEAAPVETSSAECASHCTRMRSTAEKATCVRACELKLRVEAAAAIAQPGAASSRGGAGRRRGR